MEAHESALRSLALTADGSKLATASVKGTVIRVWDVQSAVCLQEFRRGVERATITCLAWSNGSWGSTHTTSQGGDASSMNSSNNLFLSCTSDKGTAHIFQVGHHTSNTTTGKNNEEKKSAESSPSFTRMFLSTMRKSVEGDAKKSVCQVRGIPHPQACAFVSDATNLLAVAGWDADGNGVLLLSEFTPGEEPRRVGYHVLCQSAVHDASEEARRRRRLRGWTPEVPVAPEGGRLYVGERLEILEKGMEQIRFEEKDEFVLMTSVRPGEVDAAKQEASTSNTTKADNNNNNNSANNSLSEVLVDVSESQCCENSTEEAARSNLASTVGDSVRTEPLDDGDELSDHHQ
jgi:hypothetical protein